MVKSCAAYNCSRRWRKGSDISFHLFPLKKPELLKKWITVTKRKNFVPTKSTYLCSRHFTPEDYTEQLDLLPLERRKLKNDAIPSIFDFPSHMQHSVPKKRRTINRNSTLETQGEITQVSQAENVESQLESSCSSSFLQDLIYPDDSTREEARLLSASCSSFIMDAEFNKDTSVCNALTPAKPNTSEQGKCPVSPTKTVIRRKKILQQRLKRRDAKINSMKDVITILKKKVKAPERLIDVLESNFSGFPLHMMMNNFNNERNNKCKRVYSAQMKEFALTVYFYSPKAYRYLRSVNFFLPNPATLRRWLSSFNCSPGFLEEIFLYLKNNLTSKPHLKDVNLVFDSMSIRKQVIYDANKGKNFGYVTFGNGLQLDDQEKLASEALVFQIVSIRGNFKCAVGYFFINKISSEVLSKLIKMCIIKLYESGVNVRNVTFDGTSTNLKAVSNLGCKLTNKPYFLLGLNSIELKVCVMLDACHMLKLARNTLADKGTIQSKDGTVSFKYIQQLNELQKKEQLNFANKLTDSHILYRNRKMNVRIAAQTLSAGVADAIQFLMDKNDPDFVGAEPTVKFIRIIDRLFDFFNSRDPHGKHFKQPNQ